MCAGDIFPKVHKETAKKTAETREELAEVRSRSLNSR